MDFCGPYPTGETLMVVIDACSKFPEVEILKSTTTKVVTNRLDRLFATHGIPDQITTDNGPPFDSNEMANYMAGKGIKHHRAEGISAPKILQHISRFNTIFNCDQLLARY